MKFISLMLSVTVFVFTACTQTTGYDSSFIRFNLYGKGEPVFVLSGGPGNDCHQEEDVAIKIAETQQAILLEQRGTGLSMPQELNKNTINLAAYIKDILFVMDSLKINKAKFYGHSWGAMYASAFAAQYPEKVGALILTGPGYLKLSNDYQKRIFNNRMSKLSHAEQQRYNKLSGLDVQTMTDAEKNEYADIRATFNTYDTSDRKWKFAKINKGINNSKTQELLLDDLHRIHFDLTEKLVALDIPVTIITCREDPLAFLTDEYQKYVPHSKVYWLDQCGHFPMYEQPEKFYLLLAEALKK